MSKGPAGGIHLGTTYSCMDVFQHGKLEIIANDEGNQTTPSYVAFTDTEQLIGDATKNQVAVNPTSTVFDAKHLIGNRFDDAVVQSDMKHWPFMVVNDAGRPKVQVEYKGETKSFHPEEVSSMVYESERAMSKDNNLLCKFEFTGILPAHVPQIEVTFDIDVNGILNVDKSTGKENKITITNDKGCLSKEDSEHIVQEAEKYKAEDKKQRDKVSSKNSLASYAFNMKATVEDEKPQGKINDEDKQKILDKCNEIINWLYKNKTAEKEECEHQQKDLEKICNPIMTKLYQSAGGMSGDSLVPGGFFGGGAPPSDGTSFRPTIEEVD
ncbi:hypothetical protein P7K49_019121 [Saguinus oedipus]|uniref:Heat shock cognate 71 kDa protein n=1 Tax=Saguinus oedipus TaxID=9490 RepID=A0ABQ9UXC6_SAGOE|nr:hypothetical protein P7K49_019121 [Saguinus oedipus]